MQLLRIPSLRKYIKLFILSQSVPKIRKREMELTGYLLSKLEAIDAITIYGPQDPEKQVGVVSINIADRQPEDIGYVLDTVYGVMVRTGLHCAPCVHKTIGTMRQVMKRELVITTE